MKYWHEASGKTRQLQKSSPTMVKEVVACAEGVRRTESPSGLFGRTKGSYCSSWRKGGLGSSHPPICNSTVCL